MDGEISSMRWDEMNPLDYCIVLEYKRNKIKLLGK